MSSTTQCSQCATAARDGDRFCAACGAVATVEPGRQIVSDPRSVTQPSAVSQSGGIMSKVVVTGRMKKAGYSVVGGGVAIILSAFLPWVTVLGFVSAKLSGGGVLVVLLFGGGLAYLGTRILTDRVSKAIRVSLWILAALDVLVVFGFFSALGKTDQSGGAVQPAIGFYVALIGLVASIVGTIMLQTIRAAETTSSSPSALR